MAPPSQPGRGFVRAIALFGGLFLGGWTDASEAQPQRILRVEVTQEIDAAVGDDVGPNPMTLADLNGDGLLDLVAISRFEDGVFVFLGTGDGTFDEGELHELDIYPTAVIAADVASPFASPTAGEADGILDLIVADEDGIYVAQILLGNGDGSFEDFDEAQDLSEVIEDADSIVGLASSDFDGNGEIDLALLDDGVDGSRVWFLCNTRGLFGPCATSDVLANGEFPVDLSIGDFDGDGSADDLVVLNQDSDTFSLIYGLGDGRFTDDPQTFPAKPPSAATVWALDVARLDGDVLDDFVIASSQVDVLEGLLSVYPRRANTVTSVAELGQPSSRMAIAIGKLDADNAMDAVIVYVPNIGETSIGPLVLAGDGTGGFSDAGFENPVGSAAMGAGLAILLGNVGGDGLSDLVQLSDDGETITVAVNRTSQSCAGDCDASGAVTIDELIRGVGIALGAQPVDTCSALDSDGSNSVEINDLIAAVARAVEGCAA